MKDNSHKILKILAEKINKLRLSNNSSIIIDSATEKAQRTMEVIQNIATDKYETVIKRINGSTIVQEMSIAPLQLTRPIPKRLVNWWQWYQQLTGLETVEIAKQQVIMIQDKLFKCQEERRLLHRRASAINDKLKEVYAELVQTKREDAKYVHLTIMENKGLQEQSQINGQLTLLENEERDHFTQLATAIKEYHDSQAMNAMKYKYLSIIVSVVVAFTSLTGSMMYNNKRIIDMRNNIAEAQLKNETTILNCFNSLDSSFNAKYSQLMQAIDTNSGKEILGYSIHTTQSQALVYIGFGFLTCYILKMIT